MDEFFFLNHLKRHFKFEKIGDDCAVLPLDNSTELLVTTDMLVDGVDFRPEWAEPSIIGHKALAVSLSDIAAMGGEPNWALISLAIPEDLWSQQFLDRFYDGITSLADIHNVEIVGGDVSGTPGPFTIDTILIGKSPKGSSVLRSGAAMGDLIFVSGALGGAAAGLRVLEQGTTLDENSALLDSVIARLLKPTPQVQIGKILQTHRLATSMIDISDGLSSDLRHLCDASGTGARIYAERIPVDPAVETLAVSAPDTDLSDPLSLALNGGEDFELLFTAKKELKDEVVALGCTLIGEVVAEREGICLVQNGLPRSLDPRGFRHFS
jgi:thiamine-monophosphate kinase